MTYSEYIDNQGCSSKLPRPEFLLGFQYVGVIESLATRLNFQPPPQSSEVKLIFMYQSSKPLIAWLVFPFGQYPLGVISV